MVTRTANGNVYIIKNASEISSDTLTGDIIVEISTRKIEDITINELISFPIPKAPGSGQAPNTFVVDIKRIKGTIGIDGDLATDSDDTAFVKKQNLFTMAGLGGSFSKTSGQPQDDGYSIMNGQTVGTATVTVVWGLSSQSKQQIVIGSIQQLSITETPAIQTDNASETVASAFTVKMKIVVGKERQA